MMAQSPEYMPQNLQRIIGVSGIYEKIIREAQCVSLKELQLSGGDIVALGCAPGPEVGRLLQKALEEVLTIRRKTAGIPVGFCQNTKGGKRMIQCMDSETCIAG